MFGLQLPFGDERLELLAAQGANLLFTNLAKPVGRHLSGLIRGNLLAV